MHRVPYALAFIVAGFLVGCTGPKDTAVPKELDKIESIRPSLAKLTEEERELFAGYMVRQTVGAKLGGLFGGTPGPGIPDGMTIGKAIEEQRKFKAEAAIEEGKQKALKEKLAAEREAALKPMREAVTVTLVAKGIRAERGYSGTVLDEHLDVSFGYKNNTTKDISGVKGRVSVRDLFGDELSAFLISNDDTIKAGNASVWSGSRSVKYAVGGNKDRKLAELPDDKYTVVWTPQVIVFADGTKLTAPE